MFGTFRTKRSAAARTKVTRRLFVNHLEDRSLPSVSATMFDSTLAIQDTGSGARADRIRVFGDTEKETNVIRVYNNQIEIGVFKGVANIEVQATGNSTLAVDLNSYPGINSVAINESAPGNNTISFGRGTATTVKIAGNTGTETVSFNGLNAATLDVDTNLGSDQVSFGSAGAMKVVNVRSAESVTMTGTRAGDVTLDNRGGSMTVESSGTLGSLRVFSGSGSLALAGSVGGDVTFMNFGNDGGSRTSGATLKFAGKVGGALRMTGTSLADTVVFADGSSVFGNVELRLGAGNDSATFAGTIGNSGSSVSVDMGDGDDNVTLAAPASFNANKTLIALGAGNDVATVNIGTQLSGVAIDGGDGKDTLRSSGSESTFDNSGFERFE